MNLKLSSLKNSRFTPLCAVLALLAMVSETMAANVHLKSDPIFTDLGTTLNAKISLAGLGNKDVTISVQVTGLASYTLINPGGNEVPGQNKLPISSSASVTISKSAIKNGNVTVSLTTTPVLAPPATELGAPNNLWVARIDNVEFLTAVITVQQGGKVVLQEEIDLE